MIPNNNLSVFPWYGSLEEQNARKWWDYDMIYPLFTPAGYLLPFQIMRTHREDAITSFLVYDKNGSLIGDYTTELQNAGISIVEFENLGYDVIIFTGTNRVFTSFNDGQYYAALSDGVDTWYSEIFTVVNDISGYLKLEWWDVENFVMPSGTIVYAYDESVFHNILYLCTDIARPDYTYEEESVERDGYTFAIKQISKKVYHFSFLASEYLLDAMRFIRMADNVKITKEGKTYDVISFLITPEWQPNGNIAGVTAEFEADTIAKKLPYMDEYVPSEYLRIFPTSISFAGEGGMQTFSIEASGAWTITKPDWITLSQSSGVGNATITATASATESSRSGNIVASGYGLTASTSVSQREGAYIEIDSSLIVVSGIEHDIQVEVYSNTDWVVETSESFLTIVSGASGSGDGTVILHITENNTGITRNSNFEVRTQDSSVRARGNVTQSPTEERYITIDPIIPSVDGSEQDVQIEVYSNTNWVVETSESFLTVTSGASGSGDGTVILHLSRNTSGVRRDSDFVVRTPDSSIVAEGNVSQGTTEQEYINISPSSPSVSNEEQTIEISVTSNTSWEVAESSPFLSVVSGATGSGNGTVVLRITANTGAARSANFFVRKPDLSVYAQGKITQAEADFLIIDPEEISVEGTEQTLTFTVFSTEHWEAVSNSPFITIVGESTGFEDGTFDIGLTKNETGSSRVGTITVRSTDSSLSIQGTITQAPAEQSYIIIDPESLTVPGDETSLDVTVYSNGAWVAETNSPFLSITDGSGFEDGTFGLSIAENTSGDTRTGTFTVRRPDSSVSVQGTITQYMSPKSTTEITVYRASRNKTYTYSGIVTDGYEWLYGHTERVYTGFEVKVGGDVHQTSPSGSVVGEIVSINW